MTPAKRCLWDGTLASEELKREAGRQDEWKYLEFTRFGLSTFDSWRISQ